VVYDTTNEDLEIYNGTSWMSAAHANFQTLTYAASVTLNVLSGYNATLTLTGNAALTISNAKAGDSGSLIVIQDATGGRSITVTGVVAGGGGGSISLTTTANAIDVLSWLYDGTTYYWTYSVNFT